MTRATTALVSLLIAACVCAFSPAPALALTPTTTTLAVAPASPVAAGTAVTLTATVTGASWGTVLFCNATAAHCVDEAKFGAAQVTSAGTAVFKFTPGAGSYSITAEFVGFTGTGASASAAEPLTVTGAANYLSSAAITDSGTAGNYTLTGTVTAFGAVVPTGTVSFLNTTAGNGVAGTASLNSASLGFTFLPAAGSPVSTGQSSQATVLGDFNHDGILDLAVVNGDQTISVLLGQGDGTFVTPVPYAVGHGSDGIAMGDFNEDGNLDLVVSNYTDNTVSVLLGNADGTFHVQATHVAPSPYGIAVADFNGDGHLDLAVVNAGGNDVTILLGQGNGLFVADTPATFAVGSSPVAIATADFNGDGNADLVVTNPSAGSVSVLLGNGNGTFQGQNVFTISGLPPSLNSVAAGDFNGDGIPDFAVADAESNGVYVFLGINGLTFQPYATYTVGSGSSRLKGIAAADFQGTGHLDLAVTNSHSPGTVSLLLNRGDGTGTFPTQLTFPAGSSAYSIAAGDVNGDGLPDLVVANDSYSGTASILLAAQTETAIATGVTVFGTGTQNVLARYPGDAARSSSMSTTVPLTGTAPGATTTALSAAPNAAFAGQPVTLTATVTPTPTGIPLGTVSFYNGSTLLDTASVNSSGVATFMTASLPVGAQSLTAVYSGNQGFLTSTSTAQIVNISAEQSSTTTLAITPGSGVAAGAAVTLTATVTANTGAITFPLTQGTVFFCAAAAAQCTGPALFGSAQLTSAGTAAIKLTLGVGAYSIAAKFQPLGGIPASASGAQALTVTGAANYVSSTAVADSGTAGNYTLTGTVTAFGTVVPTGTVSFLDTTAGNGVVGTASLDPSSLGFTFLPGGGSPVSTGPLPEATVLGDFNHDGNLDLAVTNTDYGAKDVSVLLGNGDGTFQTPATYAVGDNSYGYGMAMGDFNGDGNLDLAVPNHGDSTVSILLGNGDGTFAPQVPYPTGQTPQGVAVADFNGDGNLDLAVANTFGYSVTVLLGQGDGTFVPDNPPTFASGMQYTGYPTAIATADFNGDGNADMVVTNPGDSTVSVLLGNGDGTFQTQIVLPVSGYPNLLSVVTGDFNGDGIPDFATADSEGDGVYVFLGINGATFQPYATYIVGTTPLTTALFGIAAADFRGTGHLDLAVTDAGTGVVGLLFNLGDGSGTFPTQALFPAPGALGIAVGDINGDGFPDVAATNGGSTGANILLAAQTETAIATGQAVYGTVTPHNVLASYAGDADRASSQSTTVPLAAIPQTATATTFTATPNPVSAGQPVTLTATVAPAPTGTTLGTVSFYAGSALLGMGTVNSSGVATLITTSLPVGAPSLTAVYSGNLEALTSTSTAQTVTVNQDITATSLAATPNPASAGQPVTLTATVAPAPIGTPLGTVSFYNGSTLLGMGTVNSSGVATFLTASLPLGTLSLTAVYSGNPETLASTSTAQSVTVNQDTTTTTLAAMPNPVVVGQPLALTATVAPAPTDSPAGTVSFYQGTTLLSTVALSGGGTATLNLSTLVFGADTVTAVYSGSTHFAGSTSSGLAVSVVKTVTTTVVTSSATTPGYGNSFTLTATITPATTDSPAGTVSFYSGAALLGSSPVSAGGVATLSASLTTLGASAITASYSGSAHFAPSTSAALSIAVVPAATSSLLTVAPNPVVAGQSATFTLTISPAPTGSPSGAVSFHNGGTLLGTGIVNSAGVATFSTTTLPLGADSITATYAGNADFAASTSTAISVQVNSGTATATVTTVTSSNPAPNYGQSVTLTATVTPAPSSTPPGTVSFYAGTTLLGAQALNAQGIASLSFSLPLGPNAITAVYSGSAGFAASTSSALSVSARALSAIAFSASPTTQLATMPVVFTAQVSSATAGAQTGTVSFLNGSTVLATETIVPGQAVVYADSGLATGVYSVTASYSGDGSFLPSASTGAPIAITVSNLDLAIGGDKNKTVVPGAAVTYNFPLSPVLTPTFLYNVTLTATGLPPGATYTFSPASIPAGSGTVPVAFTVQTAPSTGMLHRAPGSSRGPWFALVFGLLLPLAGARRVRARITASSPQRALPRMLLLLLFGALSLGLVAGLGGCGSGGFLGTPPGQTSYTITIAATSGTLVRTTTVQLNFE